MREIVQSNQFKQDLKRLKHSKRYQIDDLLQVIELLQIDAPLLAKHRDHHLHGNWQSHRECHIKPDWLLIYKQLDDKLILVRTGTHSELF